MNFKPHSEKQQLGIFSDKRIVICATGIQWGKTECGSIRTKLAIHKFNDKRDNFLVTAPTYKIMHQSTIPALMPYLDGCGWYEKSMEVFHVAGGGNIFFRTATDPDSVVGLTNVRLVWGDEAGKYSRYFWDNLMGRAAFKNAKLCLTTSPYGLNWLYHDYILRKRKKPTELQDVEIIQAKSIENPYFQKEVWDDRKSKMEPRRFNMMYGGEFEKAEGLVYDCFDYELNICEQKSFEVGTKFYGGIDWGHSHPFVLKVRAVTPEDKHIAVSEFYRSGLTILDIIQICKQYKSVWGIETFYCGPDRPENISLLNSHGVRAIAARNDVLHGIDRHYELIKSRKYQVVEGSSPHTIDEYERYHWPMEQDEPAENADLKERHPTKQFDYCMDVERYLTLMLYNSEKRNPKNYNQGIPSKEHQIDRIERLKKRPSPRTESW